LAGWGIIGYILQQIARLAFQGLADDFQRRETTPWAVLFEPFRL
jgi:hypothetical protein